MMSRLWDMGYAIITCEVMIGKISSIAYFSHGDLCRGVTNPPDGRRKLKTCDFLKENLPPRVKRSGMEVNMMQKINENQTMITLQIRPYVKVGNCVIVETQM